MKADLRGKFIAIQAYLKRTGTAQINDHTIHLQELKEQQQTQNRVSRRNDPTKIRVELNDVETKRTSLRINKYRNWNCEMIKSTSLSVDSSRKKERGSK